MELQPHQQRAINERVELEIKIEKLAQFINGSVFNALSNNDKLILRLQCAAMVMYSSILETRIETF